MTSSNRIKCHLEKKMSKHNNKKLHPNINRTINANQERAEGGE